MLEEDLERVDSQKRTTLEKINLFSLTNKADIIMTNKIKKVLDHVADRVSELIYFHTYCINIYNNRLKPELFLFPRLTTREQMVFHCKTGS